MSRTWFRRVMRLGLMLCGLLWVAGCAGDSAAVPATETTTANTVDYPVESWMAALDPPLGGEAVPLACLDVNGDQHLDRGDSVDLGDLDIPFINPNACLPPFDRREWFVGESEPVGCEDPDVRPVLVVAVGGGGTDLLDRDQGVSAGLIDIVNAIRRQNDALGLETNVILATAAIDASDSPQARMEEWVAADLARRLDAAPCLRVVVLGHSHGAVVVTTVAARLEEKYGERILGVLLDRSLLYYDHMTDELPSIARILNIYQVNDGWHGEPLASPNSIDFDVSTEQAPREPREGPLPIVQVAHSTLDDSPAVQQVIVGRVGEWLAGR